MSGQFMNLIWPMDLGSLLVGKKPSFLIVANVRFCLLPNPRGKSGAVSFYQYDLFQLNLVFSEGPKPKTPCLASLGMELSSAGLKGLTEREDIRAAIPSGAS
jgi:hypothetical protein